MSQATIADAIEKFALFNELLDNAYWECSSISNKDFIYNIISVFHHESNELNKLSIQDHHYPYEIITESLHQVNPKLQALKLRCADMILRTRTAIEIQLITDQVLAILEQQEREVGDFQ
ncbi:MAG: hypothetical protein H7A01_11320 [Hahellaceae bacterium]|jgi:hypothetical protein|nr:hypothetical protein [Hahellaceae bacterium]MCP5210094.1 hypothetical protein [Hahellaceae bacterium]